MVVEISVFGAIKTLNYLYKFRYTAAMAKRETSLGKYKKSSRSHKTKKRLEIKREMLAEKASKRKKKSNSKKTRSPTRRLKLKI